jgi:hypothetical protein
MNMWHTWPADLTPCSLCQNCGLAYGEWNQGDDWCSTVRHPYPLAHYVAEEHHAVLRELCQELSRAALMSAISMIFDELDEDLV